ncbi:MAG: NDP-hexose 2,3-dehydratase family protein, partial [Actinomycetota bacterium]
AVNTDARSVLVTAGPTALVRDRVPFARGDTGAFGRLLEASYAAGRRVPQPVDEAERRLAAARRQFRFTTGTVAVQDCAPWVLDDCGLTDPEGALAVVHVAVTTSQREVPAWDQPLVTGSQHGETTLLAQWHQDRLRFLFALTPEVGLRECVQVHPTVQRTPGPALRIADLERRDELLTEVASEAGVVQSVQQSDEGGRFLGCVGRYSIALVAETTTVPDLDATVWLSLDQIETLARRPGFFTNEARSVLSLVLGLA